MYWRPVSRLTAMEADLILPLSLLPEVQEGVTRNDIQRRLVIVNNHKQLALISRSDAMGDLVNKELPGRFRHFALAGLPEFPGAFGDMYQLRSFRCASSEN